MTVVVKTWSRIFSLYSGSFSVRIGEILETTSLCSIGRLSLFQIVWWKYPSQRGLQGTFFTKLDDFAVFGETTPSGRPCKAHRSPNVLAQGFRCASRVSRCVTSGWKTPFHALSAPDLSHQEAAGHHYPAKMVGEVFVPRCHFTRYVSTRDRNCSVVRWSQPMRSIKAYSLLLLDMTNFSVTPLAEHIRW